MGAMQRRKGARFEREAANAFAVLFPDAKRGIGQSRWGGEVPDVDGTPFWVECKRSNTTSSAALKQGTEARAKSTRPKSPVLSVGRRNGERAIASMYLEDFLILLADQLVGDPVARAEVVAKIREHVVRIEGVMASGTGKKTSRTRKGIVKP